MSISHGSREPCTDDPAWRAVERVTVDRDTEDRNGTFGARVAELRPDAVVDLVCFTEGSARQLVYALGAMSAVPHLVHCVRVAAAASEPVRAEFDAGSFCDLARQARDLRVHGATLRGRVVQPRQQRGIRQPR